MLTKNQFDVLREVSNHESAAQRDIAAACGISLGTASAAVHDLRESGCLYGREARITHKGLQCLNPYKVENAIIMAAGLSSRFAPISYEKPKGVLQVRGEVLIERQIRQLHEAGIQDITVVVGYKKEEFFYLEDMFGVKIVVNEDYSVRNNNSTLYKVRSILGNTYICSSDDYFTQNVFEPYVYCAYYSGVFAQGPTDEYCMRAGAHDIINQVTVGGADSWIMLGHVYFDRSFSQEFIKVLEVEYDLPETAGKLWEDMYIEHLADLSMELRRYPAGIVYEFDSLDELREFDPDFIENIDSSILDNICHVLDCQRGSIQGIIPIKQGLTNLSFEFMVNGSAYVYRHPGAGSNEIINRESEAYSQAVAAELGLDDTFLYEQPDEGWKISRYVNHCIPFDYHNEDHVKQGLALGRVLHEAQRTSQWRFDFMEKARELVRLIDEAGRASFAGFWELEATMERVARLTASDGVKPCLCHNDFYPPNFLVGPTRLSLIDWEYSGSADYASDLGTFICCSDYSMDEAEQVLELYFGREPSAGELRHCMAYVAIASWYWFVWAIYQDMTGKPVGEYLHIWFGYAKSYSTYAIDLYENASKIETAC